MAFSIKRLNNNTKMERRSMNAKKKIKEGARP